MGDVPAEFLEDATRDLSESLAELRSLPLQSPFSQEFQQKLFRRLHTVKGSAQTFGLEQEAKLAHLAESLLAAGDEDSVVLLEESLHALQENFHSLSMNKAGNSLQALTAKIESALKTLPSEIADGEKPTGFPEEFLRRLSSTETDLLATAWSAGDEIIILQFGVEQKAFADSFRQLKKGLGTASVIAVASTQGNENNMLLQFLLATEQSEELVPLLRDHSGRVLYQRRKGQEFSQDISDAQYDPLIVPGKQAAKALGKSVRFVVASFPGEIPTEFSAGASEIIQHLLRNAVDHGVEYPLERRALGKPEQGTIEMSVKRRENELVLTVCDDGRGIENAAEIFDSGFTTAPFVTEVSGRGVGLDVVRDAVHRAGGTVKVSSEPGRGARFEIDIPLPETQ